MRQSYFKCFVKDKIREHDIKSHMVSLNMYKNVPDVYKCVLSDRLWPWFLHINYNPELGFMCNCLLRLLIGLEKCETTHKPLVYCLCNPDARFSAGHVLFECCTVASQRALYIERVGKVAPPAFFSDFCQMSTSEKSEFIFTGLGGNYVKEHSPIYTEILYYVYNVYKMWKSKCNPK